MCERVMACVATCERGGGDGSGGGKARQPAHAGSAHTAKQPSSKGQPSSQAAGQRSQARQQGVERRGRKRASTHQGPWQAAQQCRSHTGHRSTALPLTGSAPPPLPAAAAAPPPAGLQAAAPPAAAPAAAARRPAEPPAKAGRPPEQPAGSAAAAAANAAAAAAGLLSTHDCQAAGARRAAQRCHWRRGLLRRWLQLRLRRWQKASCRGCVWRTAPRR